MISTLVIILSDYSYIHLNLEICTLKDKIINGVYYSWILYRDIISVMLRESRTLWIRCVILPWHYWITNTIRRTIWGEHIFLFTRKFSSRPLFIQILYFLSEKYWPPRGRIAAQYNMYFVILIELLLNF